MLLSCAHLDLVDMKGKIIVPLSGYWDKDTILSHSKAWVIQL